MASTDVAIIGAGPGGYVAAIKCAQLGKKVVLIDRENVGGVCLHHGCIPTKALIHAAETFHDAGKAKEFGVNFSKVTVDFAKTQEWKNGIIKKLDSGVRFLLKSGKIEVIQAEASFKDSNTLTIKDAADPNLTFKKCVIATGSSERMLPGVVVDGEAVLTSTHAIELDKIPKTLLVIGGGYIGIELSQMFAKFGTQITIVEALPRILSLLDPEFSEVVEKELKAMGATIYTNAKVISCAKKGAGTSTTVQLADGSNKVLSAEKAILSIGRVPNTAALHLENTQVKLDAKGFVIADNKLQTADPNILAIGDIIGGAMLAHKATAEAKIAAEVIAGQNSVFEARIPYAIFSDPEIAGIGISEEEAKKQGLAYTIKKFKSGTSGKAQILGGTSAFFKVILGPENKMLGLHICGDRASDMIGEAVLALEMGASAEDLALIVHPHPTLVESYGELADMILGKPTHSL